MRQGSASSANVTAMPTPAETNSRACRTHCRPSSFNSLGSRRDELEALDFSMGSLVNSAPLASPSPRVRGEGWDEGALTQAQTRCSAPSPARFACDLCPHSGEREQIALSRSPQPDFVVVKCGAAERRDRIGAGQAI